MSDIDWSEAPEGAEYFYKHKWYKIVNTGLFIYKSKKGRSFTSGEYHWADCGYHRSLTEKMICKPSKPIFTKAMADNGELPLVGMECMIMDSVYDDEKYFISVISFVGRSYVVWTHAGTEYSQSLTHLKFKPTEPKKDRAVFDLMLNGCLPMDEPQSIKLLEAIKAGKIHNVTWGKV